MKKSTITTSPCCLFNVLDTQPMFFAVNLEALQVGCAVNIVSQSHTYLRKVLLIKQFFELTGLCGYAHGKISCCCICSRLSFKRSVRDLCRLMSPWSCCFLNFINVESICSMSQNWSIYFQATDGLTMLST